VSTEPSIAGGCDLFRTALVVAILVWCAIGVGIAASDARTPDLRRPVTPGGASNGSPLTPDFNSGSPVLLATLDTGTNGWGAATFTAVQNTFVMGPTFMSGDTWDLGDGVSENQTGAVNFTAGTDPDFPQIANLLTDSVDEVIELDIWWLPGGGGSGTASTESHWLTLNPDLTGYEIDSVRLVVSSLSMTPSNGGTQVVESVSWEIWGRRTFVAFVPPTDPDGAYLLDRRYTTISVNLAEPGTAVLDWNGVNQTMVGYSGTQWKLTMTDLANGDYAYRVWARNETGSVFASALRRITVGAGIWTTSHIAYGFLPSITFDQGGAPHLCFYGGDISGNTGLVYSTLTSNGWFNESVEGTSGSTGENCSIAVDKEGTPHISYVSGPDYGGNFVIKHAYRVGTSWILESVAMGPDTETSIAIDPLTDQPKVAYYVVPSGGLMLASDSNGTWSSQVVDPSYVGSSLSLAIDAQGHPRIAYEAGTASALRYAAWTGAAWTISVVEPSAVKRASLRLDSSGAPRIAYSNSTGLMYARWDGSSWSKTLVDTKNFYWVSLALDASDRPHIGYAMGWGGDVRYAVENGTWKKEVVSHNMGGTGMAMALDPSGYAGISFETNLSGGDLAFATDVVDTRPPVTTALVSGTIGTNGWYASAVSVTLRAFDWSGVEKTSYRVDGGPWTRYATPFLVSEDGLHTIEFFSTDLTGNNESVESIHLSVDATPPSISSLRPSGVVVTSDVTLSWDATDNTSGVDQSRIRVDGGTDQAVGTATSLDLHLADGTHEAVIEVVDKAGNVASAKITFRVDSYVFSFTGPYNGLPTLFLALGLAVAPPASYWIYSWRRERRISDVTRERHLPAKK